MKYWTEYSGHVPIILGVRKKFDSNIYSFDIETTSFFRLNNIIYPTKEYIKLTKKEQEQCEFFANMYIWMFSINNIVYYGRTWREFKLFLDRLEFWGTEELKIVYVHNLSFEFQFLRNVFTFSSVLSRKSHKVMKCTINEYNIEFRCTYSMTNTSLENLPKIYQLDVQKLVGNLDYTKLRHSETELTEKELAYCENDCLVVYKYIKMEIEKYSNVKNNPLTSTGHVRRELKELISENWKYKNKVKKCCTTDGHIYNLLIDAFAGGYTHANWIYTNEIIKDVTSYDFTSSYPYVMVTHKFPMSEFKKCFIKSEKQMLDIFCYIIKVKFKNIKCKYYNNFISQNKCVRIRDGKYDNGRLIGAEEIEIILTDIDFKFILKTYNFESYEIIESYFARYDYLPIELINFILEKYIKKTKYKNVPGKEIDYALEKAMFNSIYGMTVTNNIHDDVIFDNEFGWSEIPISNEDIIKKLEKEKNQGFLAFSWGVWVTAHARNNLLENIIQLDKYMVYADTDSVKLKKGYDKTIIDNYNEKVLEKIKTASEELKIDIENFSPVDSNGIPHTIRTF